MTKSKRTAKLANPPPQTPQVRLRVGDASYTLRPGDIIGRGARSTLRIDDPAISEAHAMVSQRRGKLVLLSLRRLLSVGGRHRQQVELGQGSAIELAPGIEVVIEDVRVPTHAMALFSPAMGQRRLGPVASLYGGASPSLQGRFDPDADAHVWVTEGVWRFRRRGEAAFPITVGSEFNVDGAPFSFERIPLGNGEHTTRGPSRPIRLVAYYDGVEIHQAHGAVVTVGGNGARILSELAVIGGPVPWRSLAKEVWSDVEASRHRWDMAISRLRRKLEDAGIRNDLIRADGSGQFQLVLREGDVFDDQT